MPTQPKSHEQRRREQQSVNARKEQDQRYERETRSQDPALAAAKAFRSSQQWRDLREIALRRDPLCKDPFGLHARDGRPVAAVEVDHIVSIHAAWDRRADLSNLQPLCAACHARKSGVERRKKPAASIENVSKPESEETEHAD